MGNRKINLSTMLSDQHVGIREVADNIGLVSYIHYDAGFFDEKENRVNPVDNKPIRSKSVTMSSE